MLSHVSLNCRLDDLLELTPVSFQRLEHRWHQVSSNARVVTVYLPTESYKAILHITGETTAGGDTFLGDIIIKILTISHEITLVILTTLLTILRTIVVPQATCARQYRNHQDRFHYLLLCQTCWQRYTNILKRIVNS
ncbi:MAG: hypothetical protein A2754_01455 [Candidatus Magasanikbacteria bacterium RIFCSPHIGHO2_01_FULL_47_8]|uniref:Uncharacterized protein n=1 Tax=Candidatus Magasanikbacteria bacterium RIFCSPHIGHO2_01_FULL_47_8 TaxID=1798673 RepID=A0A1F6ME46_9BACT|nr:MAG: hypothetical protein A2754_01455 [Candidatus Magasanikbacteria bacterium RIFCSPHIGHO2_01_FULL_47_8]